MRRRGRLLLLLLVALLVALWLLDPLLWIGGRSKERERATESPPSTRPRPEPEERRPEPGFVSGVVTTATGEPLPGAKVFVSVGSGSIGIGLAETDDQGRYRFESGGWDDLTVHFAGLTIARAPLPDDATIKSTGAIIDLAAPGEIELRGFVAARDGDALPGARLSVGEHVATAGDRGIFVLRFPFAALQADPSLRVEAEGHVTRDGPLNFGRFDDLAIYLEPR